MAYRVERSEDADRDLGIVLDFLFGAALDFGEDAATALDRSSARVLAIEDAMESLGEAPHQGTLRPDLGKGLRNVTKGRAVIYFEVDDDARVVRVLAVLLRRPGSPAPDAAANPRVGAVAGAATRSRDRPRRPAGPGPAADGPVDG